jgi:general secretion pathway protein G
MRGRYWVLFCAIASILGGCSYDPMKSDVEGRRLLANTQIDAIGEAMRECAADIGRFPNQIEGLSLLTTNASGLAGWHGPYLRRIPNDPWGAPYQYLVNSDGSSAQVTCCDRQTSPGKPGSADVVSKVFSYARKK